MIYSCLDNLKNCPEDKLKTIYSIANTPINDTQDFCDPLLFNTTGFGPTNCNMTAYGLNGLGYLSQSAGIVL